MWLGLQLGQGQPEQSKPSPKNLRLGPYELQDMSRLGQKFKSPELKLVWSGLENGRSLGQHEQPKFEFYYVIYSYICNRDYIFI